MLTGALISHFDGEWDVYWTMKEYSHCEKLSVVDISAQAELLDSAKMKYEYYTKGTHEGSNRYEERLILTHCHVVWKQQIQMRKRMS